jgi:hypothetical protein
MKSLFMLACTLPAIAFPARADLTFDNADTPQFTTLRINDGIAAYLQVGTSDVRINQIGINAAPASIRQLQFLIFSDVAYPGKDSGTVLFSDTVSVSPSSNLTYILSDPFSFTLHAGQYYDMGAIFNGGNITYAYDLAGDTMGDLTSIARNESIGNFADPFCWVTHLGTRRFVFSRMRLPYRNQPQSR